MFKREDRTKWSAEKHAHKASDSSLIGFLFGLCIAYLVKCLVCGGL